MKIVICFLAILALAAATKNEDIFASRSLASTAKEVMIKIRDQMPCGFPKAGIPSLVPFVISHKEIDIDTPTLRMSGNLNNFRVYGLNDFELNQMNVHPFENQVSFHYQFSNISADTAYELETIFEEAGIAINLTGAGLAGIAFKDVEIIGSSKFEFGIEKLMLDTLEITAHIGSVETDIKGISGNKPIDPKLNEVLGEAIKEFVNDNQEFVTKTFESTALPVVNGILSKYTLIDLIAVIIDRPHCEENN